MVALSVVIPIYNEARTIGQVLLKVASALTQVSKEIIIVDDCSSGRNLRLVAAEFGKCGWHLAWHFAQEGWRTRVVRRWSSKRRRFLRYMPLS